VGSDEADGLVERASQAQREGSPVRAAKALERLCPLEPRDTQTGKRLGRSCGGLGRRLGAVAALVERSAPLDGLFRVLAGGLRVIEGQPRYEKQSATLQARDRLGDMPLRDASVASIVAARKSRLLLFPSGDCDRVATAQPRLGKRLSSTADARRRPQ